MKVPFLTRSFILAFCALSISLYYHFAYSARVSIPVITRPTIVGVPQTTVTIINKEEAVKATTIVKPTQVQGGGARTPVAPVVAAQVVWVEGVIEDTSADKKVRKLQRKDLIYEHDSLTVQKGSSGQIVFSDNTLFSLSENSIFKIDQYRFNKNGKTADERYVVDVVKGGFRTVTGLISKAGPTNYQVKTPVATIGVRGTVIEGHIKVTKEKDHEVPTAVFAVIQGAADFKNKAGTFTLDQNHKYANFSSDAVKPMYTPQPAPELKTLPRTEMVKPSNELVSKSVTTSAAAPSPGKTTTTTTTGGGTTSTTTTTTGGGGSTSETSGGGTAGGDSGGSAGGDSGGSATGGDSGSTGTSTGSTTGSSSSSTSSGSSSGSTGLVNDFSVCK